jgi:hypothetical protein
MYYRLAFGSAHDDPEPLVRTPNLDKPAFPG